MSGFPRRRPCRRGMDICRRNDGLAIDCRRHEKELRWRRSTFSDDILRSAGQRLNVSATTQYERQKWDGRATSSTFPHLLIRVQADLLVADKLCSVNAETICHSKVSAFGMLNLPASEPQDIVFQTPLDRNINCLQDCLYTNNQEVASGAQSKSGNVSR